MRNDKLRVLISLGAFFVIMIPTKNDNILYIPKRFGDGVIRIEHCYAANGNLSEDEFIMKAA